jgi:hypothetical protein
LLAGPAFLVAGLPGGFIEASGGSGEALASVAVPPGSLKNPASTGELP